MREGAPLRPDVGHSEPSCGVKINATSCLLDILTAGLPSWRRVASLSLGPSVPWRAYAPATRSPRHQNGCEAEPGTCWGMLRANHFVNRHEQGVRTMGRAGQAKVEPLARIRGGQKYAALVVRREYSTKSLCRRAWRYTGRRRARALLGYTNSLPLLVPGRDDQRVGGLNSR